MEGGKEAGEGEKQQGMGGRSDKKKRRNEGEGGIKEKVGEKKDESRRKDGRRGRKG